jgi:hypothetical protein
VKKDAQNQKPPSGRAALTAADAVAKMLRGAADRPRYAFALPENISHKHARRRAELRHRRGIRKLIRPENAAPLVACLPAPGDTVSAVLRGDFVLGDALPMLVARAGFCPHLHVSTLALSVRNAETLRDLVTSGAVGRLTLIVSHYFRAVDKLSTYAAVARVLDGHAELKIARCHAKILLLPTATDSFVLEGSANLRSSGTVEQMTLFNDPDLLAFHRSWMEELENLPLFVR